ncbi:unnamed protein product, partial [Mesorhabditis spiculigera]
MYAHVYRALDDYARLLTVGLLKCDTLSQELDSMKRLPMTRFRVYTIGKAMEMADTMMMPRLFAAIRHGDEKKMFIFSLPWLLGDVQLYLMQHQNKAKDEEEESKNRRAFLRGSMQDLEKLLKNQKEYEIGRSLSPDPRHLYKNRSHETLSMKSGSSGCHLFDMFGILSEDILPYMGEQNGDGHGCCNHCNKKQELIEYWEQHQADQSDELVNEVTALLIKWLGPDGKISKKELSKCDFIKCKEFGIDSIGFLEYIQASGDNLSGIYHGNHRCTIS